MLGKHTMEEAQTAKTRYITSECFLKRVRSGCIRFFAPPKRLLCRVLFALTSCGRTCTEVQSWGLILKCTYVNVTKKSDIRKVYERTAKELRCLTDVMPGRAG